MVLGFFVGALPHLPQDRVLMPTDFADASATVLIVDPEVGAAAAAGVIHRADVPEPRRNGGCGNLLDITRRIGQVPVFGHYSHCLGQGRNAVPCPGCEWVSAGPQRPAEADGRSGHSHRSAVEALRNRGVDGGPHDGVISLLKSVTAMFSSRSIHGTRWAGF